MTYSYTNNTNSAVAYRSYVWLPDETLNVDFPVPENLGLTCNFQGKPPDPVLFHDNITLQAGENCELSIPAPAFSQNVALHIQDMSLDSGVECSLGSPDNTHFPIDVRDFHHVLTWELCSRICLFNPTNSETVISITAIEVVS